MWTRFMRVEWMKFLFPRFVWNVPNDSHVFLTFDDGPHPVATPKVLEVLKRFGIKATFFCVGENAQNYPELLQEILNEGHALGNHTFQHENGWETNREVYISSIKKTREIINSKYFRPPYGRINLRCVSRIKNEGYEIIMWSWLSKDYNKQVSNNSILNKAKGIKAGDILVFHDSTKTQDRIAELLIEIIPLIISKKLTFSTFHSE